MKVPAWLNRCWNSASLSRIPEFPQVPVTVCPPSAQHQVTVVPTGTVRSGGLYSKDATVTVQAACAGEAGKAAATNASAASEYFTL